MARLEAAQDALGTSLCVLGGGGALPAGEGILLGARSPPPNAHTEPLGWPPVCLSFITVREASGKTW